MNVERVNDPGDEWDAFAETHPDGALGHASAWSRIVRAAYGLEPIYLAARDDCGEIAGILPLIRFKRPFGPVRLVSLPFLDSAGVLARDASSEQALLDAALALVAEVSATELEIRNARPLNALSAPASVDRINLIMDLESSEEAQWSALRAKVRNQARKAAKEGLELLEADSAAATLLDGFYDPFAVNMRDLGSPAHSQRFFRAAANEFGDSLRFIVTHDAGRPVGGLVAIDYAQRVTVPWASTLRSERRRCPNNQIYWEALRWATERQARRFDFGRSPPESGTHRFKIGWGAHEEPLHWVVLSASGVPEPGQVGERSALLDRLSKIWTRLPVGLATQLGSRLRPFFSN